MSKAVKVAVLVFAAGFALGCLVFFPLNSLRPKITAMLSQAGVDVELGPLHLGTGLGLGLSRGGLFAIHADSVSIALSEGNTITCKRLTIVPQVLPLLLGRLKASAACNAGKLGYIVGTMSGFPFWSPSTMNISVKLDAVDLQLAEGLLSAGPFRGSLSGEVIVSDFKATARSLPRIDWKLEGQNVGTPLVPSDLLSIPSLNLGTLSSRGTLAGSKLRVDELKVGGAKAPLEADLKIDFVLDPRGLPVSGDLSGRLRTDTNFEKTSLKDLNLDLIFGTVKASGSREFRKSFNGSPLSLLMNPPVDAALGPNSGLPPAPESTAPGPGPLAVPPSGTTEALPAPAPAAPSIAIPAPAPEAAPSNGGDPAVLPPPDTSHLAPGPFDTPTQ